MTTGVIFYEGPSRIDGSPIVGIATFGTSNQKTGNLVQTWILLQDTHPVVATNTGEDTAICGKCPLRGLIRPAIERRHVSVLDTDTANKGRGCYVLVGQAPANVWKTYKRGGYPILNDSHRRKMIGMGLRYGAYGDPVAIPIKFWDSLAKYCTGRAAPGYTHQWKVRKFAAWKSRVMASTHSVAENELAATRGWRTFRTISNVSEIAPNEIHCPASDAGGYTANCATCNACNGRGKNDQRKSVAIVSHGSGKHGIVAGVIANSTM